MYTSLRSKSCHALNGYSSGARFLFSLSLVLLLFFPGMEFPIGYARDSSAVRLDEGGEEARLFLVQNRVSSYRIVIPARAGSVEKKAAHLLQDAIQRIAEVTLPIVTDETEERPFEIVVGGSSRLDPFWLSQAQTGLEDDGFLIQTLQKKLIIVGGRDRGTLYGVTTFLEKYLGCRKYTAHVSHFPRQDTIELEPFQDRQVPRITYRALHYYDAHHQDYADWHKLRSRNDRQRDFGLFVHTFNKLVPPGKYFEEHPDYFSLNRGQRVRNTQLCLSHPEVFPLARASLDLLIRNRPDARFWSVSQNDIYGPCECVNCAALDAREGTPAGSLLRFVNRMAHAFPDTTITTLAYQYSRTAPRHLVPAPNVQITLCSIECDRSRPIAARSGPGSFARDLADWSAICNDLLVWDYVVQFSNYVSPFPNLRVLQPNIQLFVEHGVTAMFQQGNPSFGGEFNGLKSYLIAKLLWNPDVDVNEVIDDYLNGYFGAAAHYLRQYIDLLHDALEETGGFLDIYGHPFQHNDTFLAPTFTAAYARLFDQAEQAVAHDPELLERVRIARLPLEYTLLEQGKRFGAGEGGFFEEVDGKWRVRTEARDRLDRFVARCDASGIRYLNEKGFTPFQYRRGVERILQGVTDHSLAFQKEVTLTIPASPRYPAGGPGALTNGLKGSTDHHENWLGFEGTDMEAIIDLGNVDTIRSIHADFMQAVQFWIFLPRGVEYALSEDGKQYETVARLTPSLPESAPGIVLEPFEAVFEPRCVRYIRIRATGIKHCPDWHIGAGGKAWIFTDEVVIE